MSADFSGNILVIIQRSNGDVFLSASLISHLQHSLQPDAIDLLINHDTLAIAKTLPFIRHIYTFSYLKKKEEKWQQEKEIIKKIYRKYELSINLTASDRSVLYALFASKKSISAIEIDKRKSWWKKILLSHYYYFDTTKHILQNNIESLSLLKIKHRAIQQSPNIANTTIARLKRKLEKKGIKDFAIFHPSAQYKYKIYPKHLRDELLFHLSSLGVSIVVTGSNNQIDTAIKQKLPSLPNVIDMIGETTLEEYIALSELSLAYIGMDTLNMHIAAAQDKRIFAIFGPTNLTMWSPWSNQLQQSATKNMPIQNYGSITIFQANMPCVACGNAGCDDQHGKSECLDHISPEVVFNEVKNWYTNVRL